MKKFLILLICSLANFSIAGVTIVQFVEAGPLNLNKKGIVEILEETNIPYKYYNSQGQVALAKQILTKVMSEENDLVITITTPVTLAAISSRAGSNKPIVFSAVSDPLSSKIIKEDNYLANFITGASDRPPIDQTFEVIERIFQPKKIGFLYCNSESNSVETLKRVKSLYGDKYEIIEAVVSNSSMVKAATERLVGKVDVVFTPLDSTVLSSLELATKILSNYKIPVISNDPDTIAKGVAVAVGFNEYEVGREAALKAIRIINAADNNDNLSDLKVTTPKKFEIKINQKIITLLGITLSDEMAKYSN